MNSATNPDKQIRYDQRRNNASGESRKARKPFTGNQLVNTMVMRLWDGLKIDRAREKTLPLQGNPANEESYTWAQYKSSGLVVIKHFCAPMGLREVL